LCFDGETGEEAELDDSCLTRIERLQIHQRSVQRGKIDFSPGGLIQAL
jgi:hypothetical protein